MKPFVRARWDQAEVLAACILRFARERGARSVLDIGAGRGPVAVPVAAAASRYLAVEQDRTSAAALRAAGLDVVEATFPVALDETFDLVVSSHSIPEGDVVLYEPFLAGAWKLVASGGMLLIITFKGSNESPIRALSSELLGGTLGLDDRYVTMLRILREYGEVEITKIRSHVETDDFASFAELWGSWFWRTGEQRASVEPMLRAAADARFKDAGRYRVPEEHLVVATVKR
jgi:SAM-dependent methyltransferase